MKRHLRVLLGALVLLSGSALRAQPLSGKDYDDFYNLVILKASNATKAEWLASYDPVVSFVARVRKDVEALPVTTQRAFARAVHDNGYWKGQEIRIRNPNDPFMGATLRGGDERLTVVLTPQGYDAYRRRYAQGSRGYRFTLDVVADRPAFYALAGKTIPRVSEVPASTLIVNANAQSWDDLVADARNYPNPTERMDVILRNQFNAIASALSLIRASRPRSDAEMDYATAVIWRYTGHFSGKDGWDREPLVRILYAQLPEAERVKDRPIWQAVRDVLKAHLREAKGDGH